MNKIMTLGLLLASSWAYAGDDRTPNEVKQDDYDNQKLQNVLMISDEKSLDPYNFRNAYYSYATQNGIRVVMDEKNIEDAKKNPFTGFDFSGLHLSNEDEEIITTVFTSDSSKTFSLTTPIIVLSTIKNVRPEKVLAHYLKSNRSDILFIKTLFDQPYIISIRHAKKILKSYCEAYPNVNPAGTLKGDTEIKLNDFFDIKNTSPSKSTTATNTPQAPTKPAVIAATAQIKKVTSASTPSTVTSTQNQVSSSSQHPTSNILATHRTTTMQSVVIPSPNAHKFNWQFKTYLKELDPVTDDQKVIISNYIQSLSQDDYTYLVSLAHIKKTTPEYILAAYMQTPSHTLTNTTSIVDVTTWYLNTYTVRLQTTAASIQSENDLHTSAQGAGGMLQSGMNWLKSWF